MSGPAARILAQAKVNLYLRVLTREESGYHSIETVLHRIDHADELTIHAEQARRRTIDVEGADVGPRHMNLAYRAAVAYQDRTGWPTGFTIELVKRIPAGGGLGGGSADAAAVLRTLDSLARNPLGDKKLLSIAAALGADVTFLMSGEVMALAWGHGERMLALPPLPQRDVLLVIPRFPVLTADAYAWLDEDREASGGTGEYETADLLLTSEHVLGSWHALANLSRNSFAKSVAARHPEIHHLLEGLKKTRPLLSSMSGSGSALFGVYDALPTGADLALFAGATTVPTRTSIEVVQPIRIG
jgi:4-diphosphocytidyl-2-C-methyl-D-erythritol kinase